MQHANLTVCLCELPVVREEENRVKQVKSSSRQSNEWIPTEVPDEHW